jgi:hypothetical protein
MSKERFRQFYKDVFNDPNLNLNFRAVTHLREAVKLGSRYGYAFDAADVHEAMIVYGNELGEIARGAQHHQQAQRTVNDAPAAFHYDFEMHEIVGFGDVVQQLNALKIRPSSVDLDAFHRQFRKDDFDTMGISPASAEFAEINDRIEKSVSTAPGSNAEIGYSQPDGHLINLDLNVDHPGYEAYFQAKVKMVRLLSDFFGTEINFSGALWYPPNSYRLWHTNENQPGWRMYLTDFDTPARQGKSFFRYMHPRTKEIVTLEEKSRLVRFFRVESKKQYLFWHCIGNASTSNRWSFGFVVPENWMNSVVPGGSRG